jgi:type IV secretion system protein VirB9
VTPAFFQVLPNRSESLVNYRREGDLLVVDKVAAQWTLRSGEEATCIFNLRSERAPGPRKEMTPVQDPGLTELMPDAARAEAGNGGY